ncbi:hypothetical protein D3C77_439860 [compost metagenome]
MNVAAGVTEALTAEIVRHTLTAQQFQPRIQGCMVGDQACQAQGEAIGRMRTTLQFARVAGALEDAEGLVLGCAEIRVGLAWQVQAEPLPGQRLTVLEAGIADAAQRHARCPSQTASRLFGVEVALFDPQPQVFTIARERNIQDFVYLEVIGSGLENRAAQRLARGARAQQFQFGHAGSNKATAWTAMPSSRPVKPSFSVVVALTLTWSSST